MVNIITTCFDFCQMVRDGMLRIFEIYFDMTIEDALIIANVGPLPPSFQEYADMSVAVFTVGVGIVFVMAYNFTKWLIGIITGS